MAFPFMGTSKNRICNGELDTIECETTIRPPKAKIARQ